MLWSWRSSNACHVYDLPVSLFDEILDHVEWPFGLHALTLVSKAFNNRATPLLYSSIVITHDRPQAIIDMLEMLKLKPSIAACIHEVILDSAVSALYSAVPDRSTLAAALDRFSTSPRPDHDLARTPALPSFPVPPKELKRAAHLLCRVIPTLPNLEGIIMRSVHPHLITECIWHTHNRRIKRWTHRLKLYLGMTSQSLHESGSRHYWQFNTAYALPPAWNFWIALKHHPKHNHFKRMSLVLLDKSCIHPVHPISSLHILHLAIKTSCTYISDSWRSFLSALNRVDTLCLTNMGRHRRYGTIGLETILDTLGSLGLRCLLMHKFVLSPRELTRLQSFIASHADTLECLALSVYAVHSQNLVYPLPILNEHPVSTAPLTFPHLHTLRLTDAELAACAGCMYRPVGTPYKHPSHAGAHAQTLAAAHEQLTRFVERHPGIVDLAVTCLHDKGTLDAIERTCALRDMKRMLVGATFDAALRAAVGTRAHDWRAATDRWMYYEVMFKGLELARPEYASPLVDLPCTRLVQRHGR